MGTQLADGVAPWLATDVPAIREAKNASTAWVNTQIAVKSKMNVRIKWTSSAHFGLRANIYADVGFWWRCHRRLIEAAAFNQQLLR